MLRLRTLLVASLIGCASGGRRWSTRELMRNAPRAAELPVAAALPVASAQPPAAAQPAPSSALAQSLHQLATKNSTCCNTLTGAHTCCDTQTDKAWRHGYTLFYPFFLDSLRTRAFNMLEIGVFREKSLALWDAYFPRAAVFGADKDGTAYNSSRILQLDQSVPAQLRRVAGLRPWTVVIDDGSHKPMHQLETFLEIFPRLLPGGVYIVEDIETNYWALGRKQSKLYGWDMGDETVHSDVVERFRTAVDRIVNGEFQCRRGEPVFSRAVDAGIATVSFVPNAVVVTKRPPEQPPRKAWYRFRFQQDCGGPKQHPRTGGHRSRNERGLRGDDPDA